MKILDQDSEEGFNSKRNVEDLVVQIAAGDEHAYRQVFDQYKTSIYSTIFNLCDDEFIAEEVLQETFIRLWKYRDKLTEVINFDAWIYRVAQNVFLSKIKQDKKGHEPIDLFLHDVVFETHSYNDLEYKELEESFEQAIANLPEKQRITYQLIKIEGLSRKEVANILNVSAETVKWNLEQSVKKVRNAMIEVLKHIPLFLILFYLQKK